MEETEGQKEFRRLLREEMTGGSRDPSPRVEVKDCTCRQSLVEAEAYIRELEGEIRRLRDQKIL